MDNAEEIHAHPTNWLTLDTVLKPAHWANNLLAVSSLYIGLRFT